MMIKILVPGMPGRWAFFLFTNLIMLSFTFLSLAPASSIDLNPYRPKAFKIGGAFSLTDHHGQPMASSRLHGKPVMMAFGFTHCPDTCPITLTTMNLVLKRMGRQAESVQMVFVTVDPERDSPLVLKQYLGFFEGNVLGLTGRLEEVEDMASAYGVSFRKVESTSAAGYMVNHSSSYYLLDRKGAVRYILPHDVDLDIMIAGLQSLLGESS